MRPRPALVLAAASALLSGCVALAVPVAAGAAIGGKTVAGKKAKRQTVARGDGRVTILPAGSVLPAPNSVHGAPPSVSGAPAVPAGMQYLYGSGEAAAISLQTYRAVRNHLSAEARLRDLKIEPNSVVLARGATLESPRFVPCGRKPLAMVMDADETVLLNLGYESDAALRGDGYDEARWRRWEATGARLVRPVPGALSAVEAARKAGIAVIFNTNRSAANAAGTADALSRAGFGEPKVGETLWLRGEGQASGKDERRWAIADRYCVVALVGDQLGDFTDLFNTAPTADSPAARRAATVADPVDQLWGAGWFVLPNPVYGTALKGTLNDIFPPALRWADQAEGH